MGYGAEVHLRVQATGYRLHMHVAKCHACRPLGTLEFTPVANQIILRCDSATLKPTGWPLQLLCIAPENCERFIGLSAVLALNSMQHDASDSVTHALKHAMRS
jgi:hypothetical protein